MPDSAVTELLASYVPRLIQKRVAQNPTPIDSPLAQDFQAVVMFADISGFNARTQSDGSCYKRRVGIRAVA